MLNRSKHNFGAGAGYTIGIKGIPLTKTFDIISVEENAEWDTWDVDFDVAVADGYCDKWETADYYNGVSSDSEYILKGNDDDNKGYIVYDKEDKKIEGGVIHCHTEIPSEYLRVLRNDYQDSQTLSQKELIKRSIIIELPKECDIYGAFGSGWSHLNLKGDTIDFNDILGERYDRTDLYLGSTDSMIIGAEIKAPEIVADINWFYEHDSEIEEFFSRKKNILKRKYARRSLR